MPAPHRPYRILSLDGGGIRGLMTAVWLARLEAELGSPLHEHFDLVAGTSTGALLGCGVSKGVPAAKMVTLYEEEGASIFPNRASRLWNRATRLFSDGVSAPKYDGAGLEKALKGVFGTTLFKNLKVKPTLVTAYDVLGREAVVFKNTKAAHRQLRVWEICRASAAAPAYFPAHEMAVGGADLPLVDGGVVANNPTACAIAEAVRINSEARKSGVTDPEPAEIEHFVVASFGTGESIRRITADEAREWGASEWALPLIDVLFDGSADAVDYIARQLVDPENYFRFQTRLSGAYDDLDDATATNLNALKALAGRYIDSAGPQAQMEALAGRLKDRG